MKQWFALGIAVILAAPCVAEENQRVPAPTQAIGAGDAVRIALRNNYTFLQTLENERAASGDRMNALASILPNFSASYGIGRSESNRSSDLTFLDSTLTSVGTFPNEFTNAQSSLKTEIMKLSFFWSCVRKNTCRKQQKVYFAKILCRFVA